MIFLACRSPGNLLNVAWSMSLARGKKFYPRQESNLDLRLRRPTRYPLHHGGTGGVRCPGGRCVSSDDRMIDNGLIARTQ